MAKITREQFNKWNGQAKNGFRLDLEFYCNWGEKQLHKTIKHEDGTVTEFVISYNPEYITKTNSYGCKWNESTGRQIPTLQINKWRPLTTPGMYSVTHGKYQTIGEPEKTKKYSTLCKLSAEIDTDKLMKEQEDAA